MGKMIWLVT